MEKVFLIIMAEMRRLPARTENESADISAVLLGVIVGICREAGVIIVRSERFEKDGRMAIIVRADASCAPGGLERFRQALEMAGEKLDAAIRVQKEELFRYMHRI